MPTLLSQGIYTTAEIADLTGIPSHRVRSWVNAGARSVGLLSPGLGRVGLQPLLSFLDLVEILVAGQLREQGVTMQSVRRVHSAMKDIFSERHPFAHERLLTDGKRVFQHAIDHAGQDRVLDVLHRQQIFPEVLLPYLQKLEYDPTTRLALRWNVADGVVVDPQRSFGKPIVDRSGIPTRVLSSAYVANDNNADLVASWYEVPLEDVMHAVNYDLEQAA